MFTNVMFYVGWAVLASLPLMIAVVGPQTVKGKIIACLCVLAVTCGVMALMFKDAENARDRWNNGICNCGGTYELVAASGRGSFKDYYYSCNTCGHTEEFDNLMK